MGSLAVIIMEKLFYLAQVIGGIHTLFGVVLSVGCVLAIVVSINAIADADEYDTGPKYEKEEHLISYKVTKKWAYRLWFIVLISALVTIFVPSKRTYLFMVGGQVVDKAIEQKPEVKELPGNTLELLNEYIKTSTENLKENKEEKK